MGDIEQLAQKFRFAIDRGKHEGAFLRDLSFSKFPVGCCGDTCDLLAQYLLDNKLETEYVIGTYRKGNFEDKQSHAWLLYDSKRIIDITGDQFKHSPLLGYFDRSVYVGQENDFYRLFDVDKVCAFQGIAALGDSSQGRLFSLYRKILRYI